MTRWTTVLGLVTAFIGALFADSSNAADTWCFADTPTQFDVGDTFAAWARWLVFPWDAVPVEPGK